MVQYCMQDVKLKDGQIDIKTIKRIDLKIIDFIVTRLCGIMAPHVSTRAQIQTIVECSEGKIFK